MVGGMLLLGGGMLLLGGQALSPPRAVVRMSSWRSGWRNNMDNPLRQSPWRQGGNAVEAPGLNGGDPWVGARGDDDYLDRACDDAT